MDDAGDVDPPRCVSRRCALGNRRTIDGYRASRAGPGGLEVDIQCAATGLSTPVRPISSGIDGGAKA